MANVSMSVLILWSCIALRVTQGNPMSLWRSEDGALVEEGGRMKSLETLPQEPGVAQPPDESEEGMPRLIPLKPVFRRYRPEFHLFFDEESRMGKRENNRVPSLSVTNPIDVLRRKLLLSMAKEREARIQENNALFSKLGKR